MTYNPGQLRKIVKFIPRTPKWFIIGGPADADEAQTAMEVWHGINVLGCEPVVRLREWQEAHGFPKDRILPFALSDRVGAITLYTVPGTAGCALTNERDGKAFEVQAVTLDWLEGVYGPFTDAFVWLDIEGSELAALQGAPKLLASGRITALNIEVCEREPETAEAIQTILKSSGLVLADCWQNWPGCYHNEVWIRTGA